MVFDAIPDAFPIAYTTSTQFYNWYFDPADLASHRQNCNSTARKQLAERLAHVDVGAEKPVDDPDELAVGLDADEELLIVKRYIFLMRALFEKFVHPSLPEEVFGFAVTYFKRFYLNHSVMDFYPREMMLTCLYVACKAADFPVGLQAFIAHIPRNQERYSHFIINSELFLLESLNYDLWVFTPYRPLMGLIIDLVAYQKHIRNSDLKTYFGLSDTELVTELRREGTELINLWYQTDLCLTVHPSQFALAVLVELGRTRPCLQVEVFIRDEVCGCDPVQKFKYSSPMSQESESDDGANPPAPKTSVKSSSSPTMEDRWKQVSSRLDYIRDIVGHFDFVVSLEPLGDEEMKLEQCRNPLYNLDSEEYAGAKSRAESLLAVLE
ncbi:unnamed protein product [Dicrocoelium dendriticum]|nr:unnamed protein product [Dicrocoelium dendriticum]